MAETPQKKNIDPAVAAYVTSVTEELNTKISAFETLIEDTRQDVGELRSEVVKMRTGVEAASNSIETMAVKAKDLIDAKIGSAGDINADFKAEITEIISTYTDQVSNFQISVDEMTSKLERYFDKEKYAITKSMIVKVIQEENLHG
tara:strand:- start:467 stop:904 length:438 start_codon:yes stop_codon:yes gene_type:complete